MLPSALCRGRISRRDAEAQRIGAYGLMALAEYEFFAAPSRASAAYRRLGMFVRVHVIGDFASTFHLKRRSDGLDA